MAPKFEESQLISTENDITAQTPATASSQPSVRDISEDEANKILIANYLGYCCHLSFA